LFFELILLFKFNQTKFQKLMKNKFLFSVFFALTILWGNSAYSQIGIYYKQPDYCGRYIQGCMGIVTKCTDWGNDYCAVFEQIPCAEECGPSMAP
jgi:hypothetical protein